MGLGRAAGALIFVAALTPVSALADVGCSSSGSEAYTCVVGTGDTWTVPAGWGVAQFAVQGAAGGSGTDSFVTDAGGDGGGVRAQLALTPGAVYHIAVGAAGGAGSFANGAGAAGTPGGAGGSFENPESWGGGGGGYSSVSLAGNPVLIAGGGGGGGGSQAAMTVGGDGGGTAGSDAGQSCGAGGDQAGDTGSMETFDGTSGTFGGGGGGGGYWGGAGGLGCGGGGGSGFLAPSALTGSQFLNASDGGDGTVTITKVDPPSASITAPAAGAVFNVGQVAGSSFNCMEGNLGTGLASCTDQGGKTSGSAIDTSTPGTHSFTVTATSKDGLTGSSTRAYTVVGPPTVSLTGPTGNAKYPLGSVIAAAFTCTEAAGGPGIASCAGAGGILSGARLSSCTLGARSLTVTATSRDGQRATGGVAYSLVLPGTASGTAAGRSFTLTPATVCVAKSAKLSVSLTSKASRHAGRIATISYFIDAGRRAKHHRHRANRMARRAGSQSFSVSSLAAGRHLLKVVIVLRPARHSHKHKSLTLRLQFSVGG